MVSRVPSRRGRDRISPKSDAAHPGMRFPAHAADDADPSAPQAMVAHMALDAFPVPALVVADDGTIADANRAWSAFAGKPTDTPDGGNWLRLVHPGDRKKAASALVSARRTGQICACELRLQHADGGYRWTAVRAGRHPCPEGRDTHWLVVCTDVHDHLRARQQLAKDVHLRDDMLNVSVDCIKIIDPQGGLVHMNRAGCLALGVPEDETRFGMPWLELLPPEVRMRGQRALSQARNGKSARFPGKSVLDSRDTQYWDNLLTPLKDGSGKTALILCVSRNVTIQREVERRLRTSSEVDALTNLYNRRAFRSRVERLVRKARKKQTELGLLLLDLDHFKLVNDTFGHPAGDHLLRTLARRLKACLPADSTLIARLGGDEFAIVMDHVAAEQDVTAAARQVLRQLEAPISYSGHLINGGMSIGAAMFPRDARNASKLMACADAALNDLKAGGRGGFRMFDAGMLKVAERAVEQFERARSIVREDAIVPYFQPKVRMDDDSIVGFEALLRWHDADGGLHLPDTVAEAFHDYELATSMGRAMQSKVFADMVGWKEQGLPAIPVSINAAPVEFLRGDYASGLLENMRRFGIPPQLVEIEVTEHMLLKRGAEFVADALRVLKSHGVRVSLDDFGTGHSSFVHLRDYPVDSLKIDVGFVSGMVGNPSNLAIVRAIAKLGPLLGIDVIAEGVETEEQRAILLANGCRLGQGLLFAPARDASDTAALLRRTSLRSA
jgi:diguanylate cyclase (GGDEF)-like protein/PAS domain S-box-containing protein